MLLNESLCIYTSCRIRPDFYSGSVELYVLEYSAACSSRGMSGVTHRNSDDVASATFVWNSAADYDLNDLELW